MIKENNNIAEVELRRQIGQRLAEARRNGELTQAQMAQRIVASESSVKNWENGSHMIPADMLAEFCNELRISADCILGTGDYRVTDCDEEFDMQNFPRAMYDQSLNNLLVLLNKLSFAQKRFVINSAKYLAEQLTSWESR